MNAARGRQARLIARVLLLLAGPVVFTLWLFTEGVSCRSPQPTKGARALLAQVEVALQAYHADQRAYPRGPAPGEDAGGWLFAALCDPGQPYLVPHAVGILRDTPEGPRATPVPLERCDDPTFRAGHGPTSLEPLVLLDPWGQPLHYREWASSPADARRTRTRGPEPGGPAHEVRELAMRPESYDLWSGGADGRNDYGAPCSDDLCVEEVGQALTEPCPGGHPAPLRSGGQVRRDWQRRTVLLAGSISLLWALVELWLFFWRGGQVPAPVVLGVLPAALPIVLAAARARAGQALRCAFCHDHLERPEASCSGCGVVLHDECAVELVRCPTLGCGQAAPALRPALAA
ncbi:MAG: hypothetical protein AB7N76_29735 [Planctomycetota bacterium]